MKKVQKVCVKTIVMGRNGKSVVQTPLTVDKPTSSKGTSAKNLEVPRPDEHVDVADEDGIFEPNFAGEDSASHHRNISNFCNWEKIRSMLIKAYIEDNSLGDNAMCCVCGNEEACIRCQYCGPRQYFCDTCALTVHEHRNQFHVMEKWMVIVLCPYNYVSSSHVQKPNTCNNAV